MHPTSINKTNHLVSGDNKGLAAYFLEKARNPPGTRPGSGAFVGAFAANGGLGDASPNIDGALCRGGPHEGQACDVVHISTCPDDHNKPTDTLCIAFGPGERYDMYDSARIIATRQLDAATQVGPATCHRICLLPPPPQIEIRHP